MKKISDMKTLQSLVEGGVSLEEFHVIHGDLIQCDLCEKEYIERIVNQANERGQTT